MEHRKERRQRERKFERQMERCGTEWDNLIIMTKAADYAMHIGDRDLLVKARSNMVTAQRALTKSMFPGNAAAWEESEAGIAEWQREWARWDAENEAKASGRLQ